MIKTISAIAVVAILSGCGEAKRSGNFELKGTLTNTNGETIYLEKLINNSVNSFIILNIYFLS